MNKFQIIDGCIYELSECVKTRLSKDGLIAILASEDARAVLATDIPEIILDTAYYLSSIKIRVFTSDEKQSLPFFVFVVLDSLTYSEFEVSKLPEGYLIINNLLLLFDDSQIEKLEKLIGKESSVVSYKKLAQLYALEDIAVEFISDESRCIPYDSIKEYESSSTLDLYEYQKIGVKWITSVVKGDVGCILADEMGLGKTPQVISILELNQSNMPSLVIAPNALLENWRREFAKFAPALYIKIHAGKSRSRYWKTFLDYDVIITSYETAVNDFSVFNMINWNIIALDEAQSIKNSTSQRSQIIREFPKRAGIAVSGTPFENHVTDVWSIFDFCFRGLLGEKRVFSSRFKDNADSAKQLEKIISPLILRRKVQSVRKDLPEKVIIEKPLNMYYSEAQGYENVRQSTLNEQGNISLGTLIHLIRYCAMPSLEDESQRRLHPTEMSAKFNELDSILSSIYQRDEKVIVFLDSIEVQAMIKNHVQRKFCAYSEILNGSVPIEERQNIIDRFSKGQGFSVLIINPTVGGAGLNITAANHVIFYSLNWNPSLEDQCIARAARIGQTKTVFVYRLFYADTVEQVMDEVIARKRMISDVLVKGSDGVNVADIKKAIDISPFTGGLYE